MTFSRLVAVKELGHTSFSALALLLQLVTPKNVTQAVCHLESFGAGAILPWGASPKGDQQ